MIPPPFEYVAPKTLSEVVALLGKNPEAKILSGGHSLLPMMKFRLVEPPLLVDINRLDGLNYIREEGGWLKIGGLSRESDLERSALVQEKVKHLVAAAAGRLACAPFGRSAATRCLTFSDRAE